MTPQNLAAGAFAITPNDSADLAVPAYGIWVGVAGTVKVDLVNGDSGITFKAPVGLLPVIAKKVYATGTAATDLVGLKS